MTLDAHGAAAAVLSPLWREFVRYHTSHAFFLEVLDLFEDPIRKQHGYLERSPDGVSRVLRDLRTQVRYTAGAAPGACDVTMDAQVGINTPVVGRPASVRGAHVDNPHEIYAALLYMRDERDTATGGALEVYRCTAGGGQVCRAYDAEERSARRAKVGYDVQFDPQTMETVASVPYKANTLIMFINSNQSFHGVTPRSQSAYPRRLVNVVGAAPFL
mmetsp:Transcript_24531/g.39469  ORF Transcript_24531/g.39469 Transcript_24531/m.39469 type:complete len:216 (-) Transcript_24531:479-1126(-)